MLAYILLIMFLMQKSVKRSLPITIGNNVWISGSVTIGENTVIGAGSVVTKDIPANVVAAGVPCKVLRPITEDDKILK